MTDSPLTAEATVAMARGYGPAAWRIAAALVFAAAGATLPAAAYLVHMLGTGALNAHPDPFMYLVDYQWSARQGVLVAACLGLAGWLTVGAIDHLRGHAPGTPRRMWRGPLAALALAPAGLIVAAGAAVPAEAYHYFLRAHGPKYGATSAYVFSDEGLAWAAWDGILIVACLWAGTLLVRAAVRAWRD